jgi:O-acetyl-ADP-ribose deacetylase (regulator of RNase III)
LQLLKGDITNEKVDAIASSATSSLKPESGVAADISEAGGSVIKDQTEAYIMEHGIIPTGLASFTQAGNLPTKNVIHAVGPVWSYDKKETDNKIALLHNAVTNTLRVAKS